MKKKLPKISKGFSSTNKELKERQDYLCEEDVYTESNYKKIKQEYSDFIENNKMNWMIHVYTHNSELFLKAFNEIVDHVSNDWIKARMIVHCSIDSFEIGGVSLFEWADDKMIDYLMSSASINR